MKKSKALITDICINNSNFKPELYSYVLPPKSSSFSTAFQFYWEINE